MYALAESLAESGGRIAWPDFPVFAIGDNRPPFAQWPSNIDKSWHDSLNWLKERLGVPGLNADTALAHVKLATAEKIRTHPVRYLRHNLRNLAKPQGWTFMPKRLAYHMGARL